MTPMSLPAVTRFHHRCRLGICLFTLVMLACPSLARATTVEAVTFEELVAAAQRVFVGEVAAVESFRADLGSDVRIRTRVTFSVDQALKGRGVLAILEFLGGTVGDLTLEIAGMPRFMVGERYVVFTREGDRWVNPIVGLTQGLLRVSRDARTGTSRVLTADSAPLAAAAAIGRPSTRVSPTMITPISLADFVSEVRAELVRQGR
jgi:hypothetical protein